MERCGMFAIRCRSLQGWVGGGDGMVPSGREGGRDVEGGHSEVRRGRRLVGITSRVEGSIRATTTAAAAPPPSPPPHPTTHSQPLPTHANPNPTQVVEIDSDDDGNGGSSGSSDLESSGSDIETGQGTA